MDHTKNTTSHRKKCFKFYGPEGVVFVITTDSFCCNTRTISEIPSYSTIVFVILTLKHQFHFDHPILPFQGGQIIVIPPTARLLVIVIQPKLVD